MSLAGALKEALSVYGKDKWIGLFSMIPIIIGGVIYTLFGSYLYGDLLDLGKKYIQDTVSSGGWSEFFFWLLAGILTIAFYFLLSWTFVLVVSMLAAPFNDLISNRVEKVLIGETPDDIGISIKRMMGRLAFTLVNELKKISFIVFLNILAFALSFIGILAPIGMIISALLMSVGFLDYSWSRKNLKFGECLGDLRGSFFSYGLSGGIFLLLITVPIVNLFALPFGVVFFTVLYIKKAETKAVSI
ncbi:MAG: EI24 domain-containing protein [Halobacteriovoraceae bacterium]|jgi:CysZ protein|nr:EI24 domain-containing protein [Halobacteriovoraceae bacterium]